MLFEWGAGWLLGLFSAGTSYTAAALCHEAGHALFGILFGARCLWIRVGSVLWVPGGGVFIEISGKGRRPGECVLFCPGRKSCFCAAVGGGAVNFAAGAIGVWGWRFQSPWRNGSVSAFYVFLILFSVVSFLMAGLSLVPCKIGGKNDGGTAGALLRDREFYKRMQRNQQRDLLRLEFGMLEEMF